MAIPILIPILAIGGFAAVAISTKGGSSGAATKPQAFGSHNNIMRLASLGNIRYNIQLSNSGQCSNPANFSPPFAYELYCGGPVGAFEAFQKSVVVYFKDFNSTIGRMAHEAVVEAANANPSKLFLEVSHIVGEQQAQAMGGKLIPEVVNNPAFATGGQDTLIVDSIGDKQELVAFLKEEAAKNLPVFGSGGSW